MDLITRLMTAGTAHTEMKREGREEQHSKGERDTTGRKEGKTNKQTQHNKEVAPTECGRRRHPDEQHRGE